MKVKIVESNSKTGDGIRYVDITIGETIYTISEDSVTHNLKVNKSNDDSSTIRVMPRYSNEIEIE